MAKKKKKDLGLSDETKRLLRRLSESRTGGTPSTLALYGLLGPSGMDVDMQYMADQNRIRRAHRGGGTIGGTISGRGVRVNPALVQDTGPILSHELKHNALFKMGIPNWRAGVQGHHEFIDPSMTPAEGFKRQPPVVSATGPDMSREPADPRRKWGRQPGGNKGYYSSQYNAAPYLYTDDYKTTGKQGRGGAYYGRYFQDKLAELEKQEGERLRRWWRENRGQILDRRIPHA